MENNTLPQLVAQSNELIQRIMDNGGELTPDLEIALAQIDTKMPVKIDQYIFTMQQMEMQSAWLRKQAEIFLGMAQGLEASRDFMKERVKHAAHELGAKELPGTLFKFVIANSKPSVEIVDESEIEQIYKKEVPATLKIDKKKIEEDLRLGLPVKGAILKENKSLRISPNKAGQS